MEKLELKHLAPYLPYGLKMEKNKDNHAVRLNTYYILTGVLSDSAIGWGDKPILRPLSDLTKEGGFNLDSLPKDIICGEWVQEFYDLINNRVNDPDLDYDEIQYLIELAPYKFIEALLENHFDVFGLIEKGLAIDINTLENE